MLSAIAKLLDRRFGARRTEPGRFLLIKSWGCGFWSDMNHVFGCLLLAEITGRIPVTHWGRNSLYGDGTDRDAFQLYFEPLTPFGIRDLETSRSSTFFPPKWTRDSLRRENNAKWKGPGSRLSGSFYLDRSETIAVSDFYIHLPDLLASIPEPSELHGKSYAQIYRLLANKYLRLRPQILAEIDDFHRNHMLGSGPIIAAHYRGTDKSVESQEILNVETYFDIIDREAPDWRIFLLTDQAQCLDAFRERYGARVTFTDATRSSNETAVHFSRAADRVALGIEMLKDTYLALRCQKFVGYGMSNPSCIVSVLKDWENDCILLGQSILEINVARLIGRPADSPAREG